MTLTNGKTGLHRSPFLLIISKSDWEGGWGSDSVEMQDSQPWFSSSIFPLCEPCAFPPCSSVLNSSLVTDNEISQVKEVQEQ